MSSATWSRITATSDCGRFGSEEVGGAEGNVLVIDFEDPTLGVQRKRILRLTDEELEFKDEQYEATEVLRKMKDSRK